MNFVRIESEKSTYWVNLDNVLQVIETPYQDSIKLNFKMIDSSNFVATYKSAEEVKAILEILSVNDSLLDEGDFIKIREDNLPSREEIEAMQKASTDYDLNKIWKA